MVKALGTVQIAHDRRVCFGASPFWDSDQCALIYVDVNKRSIYRYRPGECVLERYKDKDAKKLAFAIPVEGCSEDFVVATDREIKLFKWCPEKTTETFYQHGCSQQNSLAQSPMQRISTGEDRAILAAECFDSASTRLVPRLRASFCKCGKPRRPLLASSRLSEQDAQQSAKFDQISTRTYGWDCKKYREGSDRGLPRTLRASRGRGGTGGSSANGKETEGNREPRGRDDSGETEPIPSRAIEERNAGRVQNVGSSKTRDRAGDDLDGETETGRDEDVGEEGDEACTQVESIVLAKLEEPEPNFYKTGKVDTCGRLWVGTSGEQNGDQVGCVKEPEMANIYGVTWQNELKVKIPSVSQSSGMAWSPDNRTFYMLDATEACVFAYDFHAKTGKVACPRAIFDTSVLGKRAVPHGMTIDNDGYLYIGIYGLGKVIIVDPETRKMAGYICIPTPYVTGLTWGGEMLDTLYVTTAARQANIKEHPKSGSLFQVTNLMAKGFKNLKANIVPP